MCEGQAFWLFEGRIGRGSCKLPNNLSLHSAGYDCVPSLFGSRSSFWCWSFPWLSHILKYCCTISAAELISVKNKGWKFEVGHWLLNLLGKNLFKFKNALERPQIISNCFTFFIIIYYFKGWPWLHLATHWWQHWWRFLIPFRK